MQQPQWAGVLLSALVTFTTAADATDVDKLSGVSGFSASGADLNLSVDVDDGASLIVVIGIAGDVPPLTTVKLIDTSTVDPEPELAFISVGAEDNAVWDIRVEIWKLDNKKFEVAGGEETEYDEVQIDFPAGNDRTYAYAFELGDQNAVDVVRLFAADHDESGTMHSIDPFVLEPDAMVISAHLYTNGDGFVTASGNRTEDWDQELGDEGFYVQHATPNAAATHEMKVTTSDEVDSITCGVVIRASSDILHTPTGSPGTLGDASTAGWWLEGLTATGAGDREDITDWGDYITLDKATWIRGDTCDGNQANDNLDIGDKDDDHDLDPTDFSPLNPDRDRKFEKYLEGLEENLNDTREDDGQHRHISSWDTYGGVVIWDLEFFCLDYGGTAAGGGSWGPPDVFNPAGDTEMDEWEYDAAVRYYWERVHQWFVHVYTDEGVEALLFYHHPQQPTRREGLEIDETWDGKPWQDDSHWIYKMQGAFDGHCYPMITLGDDADDIETWCRNVFENFRGSRMSLRSTAMFRTSHRVPRLLAFRAPCASGRSLTPRTPSGMLCPRRGRTSMSSTRVGFPITLRPTSLTSSPSMLITVSSESTVISCTGSIHGTARSRSRIPTEMTAHTPLTGLTGL